MRLSLFGRGDGPLRIPVPDMLQQMFGVWFRATGPRPERAWLLEQVRSWIHTQAPPAIRSGLEEFLERPLLALQVADRGAFPEPELALLQALSSVEEEEGRYRDATHVVSIVCPDLAAAPHMGYWGCLATAEALAASLRGVAVDLQLPRLLAPREQAQRWDGAPTLAVSSHIVVPTSIGRSGLAWMTTRGMGKFGLPELEVRDVSPGMEQALVAVVNGAAQFLLEALEEAVREAGSVRRELVLPRLARMTVGHITRAAGSGAGRPPEGVRGWSDVGLSYIPGRGRGSDFVRLCPPTRERQPAGVWLAGLVADFVRLEDPVSFVSSDSEEMETARLRALHEWPAIRERFQKGLPPGHTLYVKHGFPSPDRDSEFMWVAVTGYRSGFVEGVLSNEPCYRLDLRCGQEVRFPEAEVYDWLISRPGGDTEGGYTIHVVDREGRPEAG